MNFLNRALREIVVARQSLLARMKGENRPELIPFVVNLPADVLPPWMRLEEVQAAIRDAAAASSLRFGVA